MFSVYLMVTTPHVRQKLTQNAASLDKVRTKEQDKKNKLYKGI